MTLELIFGILLAGLLSDNYALLHFLGTGAVIENERTTGKSLIIGLGTTIVIVLSTLITWPINTYLLAGATYLRTLVFVCVIMLVVELVHVFAKNRLENYCKVDFMKFAINGAVLGLCIHNTEHGFVEALITAAAVGIGLMITMAIFSALHEKVDEESVPKAFRGLPIALLTAGMIALALLTF